MTHSAGERAADVVKGGFGEARTLVKDAPRKAEARDIFAGNGCTI